MEESAIESKKTSKVLPMLPEMERMERQVCNYPLIFAEMLKNEINANEEHRLYNGVKRMIDKFSADRVSMSVLNEFTGVLTGGASLEEIIRISLDEAESPTPASGLTTDDSCKKH